METKRWEGTRVVALAILAYGGFYAFLTAVLLVTASVLPSELDGRQTGGGAEFFAVGSIVLPFAYIVAIVGLLGRSRWAWGKAAGQGGLVAIATLTIALMVGSGWKAGGLNVWTVLFGVAYWGAGVFLFIDTVRPDRRVPVRPILLGILTPFAAGGLIIGGAASVSTVSKATHCSGYKVERAAWLYNKRKTAERIVECKSLIGDSMDDVVGLLGRESIGDYPIDNSNSRVSIYRAGVSDSDLALELNVQYNSAAHVEKTWIYEDF